MRSKPLFIGLALGLVGAIAVSTMTGAKDQSPSTGAELYERLTAAAAAGDQSAADYKRALDEHLTARGLGVRDLPLPAAAGAREVSAGPLRLAIEDNAPWGISVANRTELSDAAAVDSYRAARSEALRKLAAKDPSRELEVVIAPAAAVAPSGLAGLIACPCQTGEIIVDVVSDEGWLMTSARQFGRRDLAAEAAAFDAELLEQAAASLDQFSRVNARDLRLEVRSVRLFMPAAAAEAASRLPEVLLVDPLTDLADAHHGRAAVISVSNPPDVREAHARLVLGSPLDASFVQPGE